MRKNGENRLWGNGAHCFVGFEQVFWSVESGWYAALLLSWGGPCLYRLFYLTLGTDIWEGREAQAAAFHCIHLGTEEGAMCMTDLFLCTPRAPCSLSCQYLKPSPLNSDKTMLLWSTVVIQTTETFSLDGGLWSALAAGTAQVQNLRPLQKLADWNQHCVRGCHISEKT